MDAYHWRTPKQNDILSLLPKGSERFWTMLFDLSSWNRQNSSPVIHQTIHNSKSIEKRMKLCFGVFEINCDCWKSGIEKSWKNTEIEPASLFFYPKATKWMSGSLGLDDLGFVRQAKNTRCVGEYLVEERIGMFSVEIIFIYSKASQPINTVSLCRYRGLWTSVFFLLPRVSLWNSSQSVTLSSPENI